MRRGIRIRGLAVTTAAMAMLTACTGATTSSSTTTTTDPATPTSIEFTIAAEPSMTTDPDELPQVKSSTATLLGDRLILGGLSGGVQVFAVDDDEPVWELDQYGDDVGEGSTRSLPLRTSSAAGGIVLVGYTEECLMEGAPCTGAPKRTESILGVAAVAASDGEVVWRSELGTSGPEGSATDGDGIYLEPEVVDADDRGVLVTVSTNDGEKTPSGSPGMTTVLLDAKTGAERWRVTDFRGGFLTDESVLGVAGTGIDMVEPHPNVITAVVDRSSGDPVDVESPAEHWVASAGGPGAVLEDRDDSEISMQTRNIGVVGSDGKPVPSGADDQNLAQATCPLHRVEKLMACAVIARSNDSVLVTWASGEDTPTSVPAPLPGYQQLWAVSGDVLLISENGYQQQPDVTATWFAARRDGTVISERHPGAVVAASEKYVVTRTVDAEGAFVLNVFPITRHP